MDFTKTKESLEKNGFKVSVFETAKQAAEYIDSQIDGVSVGFGGSVTISEMGLYEKLEKHNKCYWHHKAATPEEKAGIYRNAAVADVYLSSVNGLAETGEIINIDGSCNRVSATVYGHKKVYFVAGENKIAPDYDKALWRARNIAAPLNAQRLHKKTPCAVKGDRCYDCSSPERICCNLSVLWKKPLHAEFEVVLINEKLGF